MILINKKIPLFVLFFTANTYAQSDLISEKPFEPNAMQAPGVERVGAVPLPIQNFGNMPVGQSPQYDGMTMSPRPMRKGSFETTYVPGRVLFLNGENISSIRNQELENVNVQIDKNGNIYIEAPQYEVGSEQSYHPLLQKELPKFKKNNGYGQPSLPQGVYSKETGKAIVSDDQVPIHSAESPASMPKGTVPEINSQGKIPPINLDGIQSKGSMNDQVK